MPKLYLIGTCHIDQKGPERLSKLFELHRPKYICLEGSKSDEEPPQRISKLFDGLERLGKYNDKLAKALMNANYETRISEEYKRKNSQTHVKYLGKDSSSKPVIEYFMDSTKNNSNGLEDFENDINMFIEIFNQRQEVTDNEYYQAFFTDKEIEFTDQDDRIFMDMDRDIEIGLRNIFREAHLDDTIDYVGGMAHIFGYYRNLYMRLKDLSPERIRLVEADKI